MLTFWLKFALAKKPLRRVVMITQTRDIRCYCHHAMPEFVIILTQANQNSKQNAFYKRSTDYEAYTLTATDRKTVIKLQI